MPGALLLVVLVALLEEEAVERDSAIMRRTSSTVTLVLALTVGDGVGSSSGGFTARVTPRGNDGGKDFEIVTTKNSAPKVRFDNGPDIVILNTSTEPISFTFKVDQSWLQAPGGLTIQSGESKTVKLKTTNKTKGLRPTGWGKHRDYNGKVTVTGGGETVTFSAHLRKNKRGSV